MSWLEAGFEVNDLVNQAQMLLQQFETLWMKMYSGNILSRISRRIILFKFQSTIIYWRVCSKTSIETMNSSKPSIHIVSFTFIYTSMILFHLYYKDSRKIAISSIIIEWLLLKQPVEEKSFGWGFSGWPLESKTAENELEDRWGSLYLYFSS